MKKMKLYLCGPGSVHPFSKHTLGLGYLQSNCVVNDWEIDVVLDNKELKDCDMIALSSEATGAKEAVEILARASVPVIIGGQLSMWEELQEYPFKHLVVGEGEQALRRILEGCDEKILHFRNIEDLDTLKFPTRRFYNRKIYAMTSRGCPYRCNFCASMQYWDKPRWHSAEYVIDDILQALGSYPGAIFAHFVDDLFTIKFSRLVEIHDLWMKHDLHKRLKLYNVSIRAGHFNREVANLLGEMGLDRLRMGVESVSPRIQKILGKEESIEKLEEVVAIAKELGVFITTYFMHKVPSETPEDLMANYEFIDKHKGTVLAAWVHYRPFPGCAMYDGTNPMNEMMVVKMGPPDRSKIKKEMQTKKITVPFL